MTNPPPARLFPTASTLAAWQHAACPTPIAELFGDIRSMGVVVPHPDDETLGCGGLIAAAAARGIAVTVTVLTDGAASHPGSAAWPADRLRARRRIEVAEAVAILTQGNGGLIFAGAPDGALAAHGGTAAAIPPADLLVTCWRDDPHPDHRAAYAIALSAAEAMAARLLAFPLWVLTTDLAPPGDYRVLSIDAEPWHATRQRALAAHRSQIGALITDDPNGFVLDAGLQALFVRRDELYLVIR